MTEQPPTPIILDLTPVIDREGPVIREVRLVNNVIDLANAALREYGVEIVPSIDFKKEGQHG